MLKYSEPAIIHVSPDIRKHSNKRANKTSLLRVRCSEEERAKKRYQKPRANKSREAVKEKLRIIAYDLLEKHMDGGIKQFGLSFLSPYAKASTVPIYQPTARESFIQPQPAEMPLTETLINTADALTSSLGGLPDFQQHGEDYAETAFQRKMRNQANKKKRGRSM